MKKKYGITNRFLAGLLSICMFLSVGLSTSAYAVVSDSNATEINRDMTSTSLISTGSNSLPKQQTNSIKRLFSKTATASGPIYYEPASGSNGNLLLTASGSNGLFGTKQSSTFSFDAGIYTDSAINFLEETLTSYAIENNTYVSTEEDSYKAEVSNWEYEESKFLGIKLEDITITEGIQYQIVVEMDPILYIEGKPEHDFAEVTYTLNDNLPANLGREYELNPYSVKQLTYKIGKNETDFLEILQIKYDRAIWNKQKNASLGDGKTPLIRVRLEMIETGTDGENISVVDSVALWQATSGDQVKYNTHTPIYINDRTDGYSTSGVAINFSDRVRLEFKHMVNTDYVGAYYFKKMTLKLILPTYTLDGTEYVMEVDEDNSDITFAVPGGKADVKWVQNGNTVTYTLTNAYFRTGSTFTVYLKLPAAIENIEGLHSFTGNIELSADGVDIHKGKSGFYVEYDNAEDVKLEAKAQYGLANISEPDVVKFLGTLGFKNASAVGKKSKPLTLLYEFDYDNKNSIGVTTVRLPTDTKQENLNVLCTLVDRDGNLLQENGTVKKVAITVPNAKYYDKTEKKNMSVILTRSLLPEKYQKYYFKTLEYDLKEVGGQIEYFKSSGTRARDGAGTIWGYVFSETVPNKSNRPKHRLTIFNSADIEKEITSETKSVLKNTTYTNIDNGKSVSYGLKAGSISKSEIEAGNSVTVKGTFFVNAYPYVSLPCLTGIRIGFLLPEGMSINKESIQATVKGQELELQAISSQITTGGNVFHTIEFKKDSQKRIGYYTESLESIENGDEVLFSVNLETSDTMAGVTLNLSNIMFAAATGLENGSTSGAEGYSIIDTYDLNGNGKTDDKIAKFKDEDDQLKILEVPAALSIQGSLEVRGSSGLTEAEMKYWNEIVTYNLQINCNKSGQADEFRYYIPIVRKSLAKDGDFVLENETNLQLADIPKVETHKGAEYEIFYLNDPNIKTFMQADKATGWSNDWSNVELEDVTILKIIVKESDSNPYKLIELGANSTVSVPLKYAGDWSDYLEEYYKNEAGMVVQWAGKGFYYYLNGSVFNGGYRSSDICTIKLSYEIENTQKITLTAAKGEPKNGSKEAEFTITRNFLNSQEYVARNIVTENVTLASGEVDLNSLSGEDAKTTFRIEVSANKKDSQSNSPVPLLNEASVGTVDSEPISTTFKFKIYNADVLSDNALSRTITMKLVGDHGVIIPVEITINVEPTAAEAKNPGIVKGKWYNTYSDQSNSVTITQNSSFTAQFVTTFIPDNYGERMLVFGEKPVLNTTIVMIDWTDAENPKFYYKKIGESDEATISLTDFTETGVGSSYMNPTGTDPVNEKLLFIVEFPESGEACKENTISLKMISQDDTDTLSSLKFVTVSERSFNLEKASSDSDFGFSYSTSVAEGADTRYANGKMALVMTGDISPDTMLKVGTQVYSQNINGQFIIPLGDIGNGNIDIDLITVSSTGISLNAYLWASTSAADKPFMGNRVDGPVTVSVEGKTKPSLEVISASRRLLHKADLDKAVSVLYDTEQADSVTVELHKKSADGYAKVTNIVQSVNGNIKHDTGVFTVSEAGGILQIRFSSAMEIGTYRLVFKATYDGNMITVPYNLILVE